jgi:hypothetical protein
VNRHPLATTASAIFTASSAATRRTPPTTDRETKLYKKGKGKEAELSYMGNVMTENRNGFVVEAELRQVSGTVERETAKDMIVRYSSGARRITVGPTRASTRPTSWPTCANSTLRRTCLKTRPIASLPVDSPHDPPFRIRHQPADAQTS